MTATATTSAPPLGEIQYRALEVRAVAESDGHEFTGIGVPFNDPVSIMGLWTEEFAPGSVRAESSLILYRHDEPVGKVTASRDTDAGFEIDATLSRTPRGDECAQLLRDGVLTKLSIGFEPVAFEVRVADDGTETIVYTDVIAREFSLVPFPAYDAATVSNVRHRPTAPTSQPKETDMTVTAPEASPLTRADLDPINEALNDIERRQAAFGDRLGTLSAPSAGMQWRSMGAFLKAVASGDENAAEFHRVYTGSTTADSVIDTKGTFVGEYFKMVEERRKVYNLFSSAPLPPEGMTVDFARLESITATVGKQAKEGDNLPGPAKVKFTPASAPVETYGGYTEFSRQAIERANTSYLDTVLKALGIAYAKETNAVVREKFLTVLAAQAANGLTLPAIADYTDWFAAIVDAGQQFDDNGFAIKGLLMSPDWFKELATTPAADGRPVMTVTGTGVNVAGEVNLPEGEGNLARVPVQVLWGTSGKAAFYDPIALETRESAGAPAQLQDENIINLTKQFSIYGYLAVTDPFPKAIVPVTKASE